MCEWGCEMGCLDFIAAIVGSLVKLAWPAAVFGSVWIFRERIEALLPNLKLKYKEFDVSFRLDEAEKDAAKLPKIEAEIPPTPEEKTRFERIAEVSPRAAVMETKLELESFLSKVVENLNLRTSSKRGPGPLTMMESIRYLRSAGTIDQATSRLLDELRAFGNIAAHEIEAVIGSDDAIRYKRMADQVMTQLSAARWFEKVPDND
jgi:hypothetical protein